MGHTAVSTIKVSSVTLKIWQHGAKDNYCNFATFNRVVTKTGFLMTKVRLKQIKLHLPFSVNFTHTFHMPELPEIFRKTAMMMSGIKIQQ